MFREWIAVESQGRSPMKRSAKYNTGHPSLRN
jgi:hypothetical protein